MDESRQPSEADGLPAPEPHLDPARDADLPPGFFPLRLVHSPTGRVLEMTRADVLVGRHTEVDVRLPLPDVSRRHCRFLFREGRWQVIDLNSLNGLFVNYQSVQQAELHQNDLVRIGGFVFAVDLGSRLEPAGDREGADEMIRTLFEAPPEQLPPHRRAS
jgi:pSer/pThr/pTyr-binding forkhead associated (FHA) protein